MKVFIIFKQSFINLLFFISIVVFSVRAQAQSSNEINADKNTPQVQSVHLVSFTASLNNNKADLKWETEGEFNLSHFVIEKSADGVNYNDAGIFFSYGNAIDKTNYSFSDKLNNNQPGIVYYRLYSVANNGKGEYSEISVIKIGK